MATAGGLQQDQGTAKQDVVILDNPKVQRELDELVKKRIDAIPKVMSVCTTPEDTGASPSDGWKPEKPLAKAVFGAGFAYDPMQDIIYSTMNNVQRKLGYCKMYDDTAIGISSVIDCEPVYFSDGDYDWMIELWKGQYGIETGAEIGIYRREKNKPLSDIEKKTGKIYDCIPDDARLEMFFELKRKKDNKPLFSRGPEEHWWLTGFKWGLFMNPDEVYMDATIRFKAASMMTAFANAMDKMNYNTMRDPSKNIVTFRFDTPATKQPKMKTAFRKAIQKFNESMVGGFLKMKTKLNIQSNDPNVIDIAVEDSGSKMEKMVYKWMIGYFKKRHKAG
jgi:hypothetical protein